MKARTGCVSCRHGVEIPIVPWTVHSRSTRCQRNETSSWRGLGDHLGFCGAVFEFHWKIVHGGFRVLSKRTIHIADNALATRLGTTLHSSWPQTFERSPHRDMLVLEVLGASVTRSALLLSVCSARTRPRHFKKLLVTCPV